MKRTICSIAAAALCCASASAQLADQCESAGALMIDTAYNGDFSVLTASGAGNACTTFGGIFGRDAFGLFTAPADGLYTFSTCGEPGDPGITDTVLAVYTNTCPTIDDNVLGCNDDLCGLRSEFSLPMTAGQQVLVRVGRWDVATSGLFTLRITQDVLPPIPDNDVCADAFDLNMVSLPYQDIVDTRAAGDGPLVECSSELNTSTRQDIWYRYTAAEVGFLIVTQEGLQDTVMAAYNDCTEPGSVPAFICVDDPEIMIVPLAAGQTVYIQVGLWSSTALPSALRDMNFIFTPPLGACCLGESCSITTEADCLGDWFEDVSCEVGPQYAADLPAPLPIPDFDTAGVSSQIVVAEDETITSIQVTVDIAHSWLGDVRIDLTSPMGSTATLVGRPGRSGLDCLPLDGPFGSSAIFDGVFVFTDTSFETVLDGAISTGGDFVPSGEYLASDCDDFGVFLNPIFAGQSTQGVWTLTVSDYADLFTGALFDWGISFNGQSGAFVCDGGVDPLGACCVGANCTVGVLEANCAGTWDASNTCDLPASDCCKADFNRSGSVTVDDIFAFLSAWFGNDPAADINNSSTITVDDIFAFLSLWFAGCPA